MDPLETINPLFETTSHLMYESYRRGHLVFFLESHDLYIRNNRVLGRVREIRVTPGLALEEYWPAAISCVSEENVAFESIEELDVLFLRKNPPLVYETMEILESVNDKLFILNGTRGQMVGNSKLYALNFPDLIPQTHVSRDPERLRKVIDDFGGFMVIKPLQRFGGEGVIKVSSGDAENLNSLINYYVRAYEPYPRREPILVQEYLEAVRTEGDVRVLMLNGEVLGAMRRKPHGADFRANISAGGVVHAHELNLEERRICTAIKQRLIQDRLYFVGIDIIGGKLVEINCVSPGGIPRINQLCGLRLEQKVIDFVEANAGVQ